MSSLAAHPAPAFKLSCRTFLQEWHRRSLTGRSDTEPNRMAGAGRQYGSDAEIRACGSSYFCKNSRIGWNKGC